MAEKEIQIGAVKSESRAAEVAKEEQSEITALDELLSVVDLDAPLIVEDHAGNKFSLSNKRFLEYYMPKGATRAEVYHCYQAVRASGLSLLIPGECYFFSTGDGPIKLFTGYPAYLRKAYAAGLEHIEKPEIEFDEDGTPISCTITLQIKDRPPFVWTTWFDEVAVTTKDGKLNKRWAKAGKSQFIKCSVVNNLRYSGLVDFTLPYIVDEMPDPVAEGFRTITQEQLNDREDQQGAEIEADGSEASDLAPGPVSATHHQIDLTPLRKSYFASIKGLFKDDDQRHRWQEEFFGTPSASDFAMEDYAEAFKLINSGDAAKWVAEDNRPDPDSPDDVEVIQKPEKPQPEAKGFPAENSAQMTDEEAAEFFEIEGIRQKFLDLATRKFPDVKERDAYCRKNVNTGPPKEWGIGDYELGLKLMEEMPDYTEVEEAKKPEPSIEDQIAELLKSYDVNIRNSFFSLVFEKFPVMAERIEWLTANIKDPDSSWTDADYAKGIILLERLSDPEEGKAAVNNLAPILTKETFEAVKKLVVRSNKYPMMRSKEFRSRAAEIIDHKYGAFKKIREAEGKLILAELEKEAGAALDAEFEADATDDKDLVPPGLLTKQQLGDIEHYNHMMPHRYGINVDSTGFRTFIINVIHAPFDELEGLTEEQGDEVIEAMKNTIREEADKKNGESKATHVK